MIARGRRALRAPRQQHHEPCELAHVVRQSPAARTGRDFWSALGDDAPPLPGVSPRAASVAPPALAASELEPGWFRRSSTVCIAVVPERERAASERDGAAARGSVRPPRG